MREPKDDRTWQGRLCDNWGVAGLLFAWGLTVWRGEDSFYWNGALFLSLILYNILYRIWDQLRQQTSLMCEEDHLVIEVKEGTAQNEELQ